MSNNNVADQLRNDIRSYRVADVKDEINRQENQQASTCQQRISENYHPQVQPSSQPGFGPVFGRVDNLVFQPTASIQGESHAHATLSSNSVHGGPLGYNPSYMHTRGPNAPQNNQATPHYFHQHPPSSQFYQPKTSVEIVSPQVGSKRVHVNPTPVAPSKVPKTSKTEKRKRGKRIELTMEEKQLVMKVYAQEVMKSNKILCGSEWADQIWEAYGKQEAHVHHRPDLTKAKLQSLVTSMRHKYKAVLLLRNQLLNKHPSDPKLNEQFEKKCAEEISKLFPNENTLAMLDRVWGGISVRLASKSPSTSKNTPDANDNGGSGALPTTRDGVIQMLAQRQEDAVEMFTGILDHIKDATPSHEASAAAETKLVASIVNAIKGTHELDKCYRHVADGPHEWVPHPRRDVYYCSRCRREER